VIYLSGSTNDAIQDQLIAASIGLMVSQNSAYSAARIRAFPFVAYDNGCFSARWDADPWMAWLVSRPRDRVLFAVAPDVYPDPVASQTRGMEYAPIIREETGLPVAIVAQSGAEDLAWEWSAFSCLFLGGAIIKNHPRAEWKESAACAGLVKRARNAGLWVHMGRVNDQYRYALAERIGCHSADGTMLAFGPSANIGRLVRMIRRRNMAPPLPLERWETPTHPAHRAVVE
jgi:hypothetical protein